MATTALGTVLHNLRHSMLRHDETGRTDGELLECFLTRRDEDAFAALLRRHGPMVLGVCRRLLRHEADAEDAFQATFLVFVRKAASIRPRGMVGNWLYGVAHSTALKASAMSTKRLAKEREAAARPKPDAAAETGEQLQALLDQELKALSDKYRTAIVLCDLEGQSIKDAARQLGCPPGTVGTRLARGRVLLARRLARRGLALSGAVLTAALSQAAASAGVPPALASSTLKAATLIAAGQSVTAEVISAEVAALTEGVLKTMLLTKLKSFAAILLIASFFGTLAGVAYFPPGAAGQTGAEKVLQSEPSPAKNDTRGAASKEEKQAKKDEDLIQGQWKVKLAVSNGREITEKELAVEITRDKLVLTSAGQKVLEASYRLDASKNPKWIDLTDAVKRGEKKVKGSIKGIYRLDGDELAIVLDEDQTGERPTRFLSVQGTSPNDLLLELKRAAPRQEKDDARAGDTAELQGTWKVVRSVQNGAEVGEDPKAGVVRMYFQGDKVYEMEGELFREVYTFAVDRKADPATIDFTSDRGGTVQAIYRIERETLTLCRPIAPSMGRPTRFASEADSNLILWVLKPDPKAPKLDFEKVKAEQKARTERRPVVESLMRIVLAMHAHLADKGSLPAAAIFDGKDKPLLSWRVALLPYLGEEDLYKEFKLDEPWDSDHNKKLLVKMPGVYGDAGNETAYQVFVGDGTAFDGTKAAKLGDIPDGAEHTILIAVAAQPVPWTKPADLSYLADKPLPKLGGKFKEGFHVAAADGRACFVPTNFNEKTLRALITIAGGESETFADLLRADARDEKKQPPQEDAKELQGDWQAVELEGQGQKAPAEVAKEDRLVFKGDEIDLITPQENSKGKFKLDPGRTPKQIDIIPLDGPLAGKTIAGIYSLEKGKLRICLPDAAKDPTQRPQGFKTGEAGGHLLMTLERAKAR